MQSDKMSMRIKHLAFILFAIAVCGCGKAYDSYKKSSTDEGVNLESAKSKWTSQKHALNSYYLSIGYSGAFGYLRVISQVESDTIAACTEAYRPWQETDERYTPCASLAKGDTVESLFQRIENGILSGQLAIAEYDPEFGVPTQIYIKAPETGMADATSGFSTSVTFSYPIP